MKLCSTLLTSLRRQSHPNTQTQYYRITVHDRRTCGYCTYRQMDGLIRHLVGRSVIRPRQKTWSGQEIERNDVVTTRHTATLCSPHACWDCGFESHGGLGCFSTVNVVCCQVEVSAARSWSFVQRSVVLCCVWSRNLVNVVAISSQVGCHISGQGCQTSFGKGLQPLLQAGSRATRLEIAIWYTFTRHT